MKPKQSSVWWAVQRGSRGVVAAGVALALLSQQVSAAPVQLPQAPLQVPSVVGLRQGASGSDVRAVQQALVDAGVTLRGGVDGQFGPGTRQALIDFQTREGLPKTGEVDEATAASLSLVDPAVDNGGIDAPATAFNGLAPGASGDSVRALQDALLSGGAFLLRGADGQYNDATEKAVTDYQRWNGLRQSGIVDLTTAQRLGLADVLTTPAPSADRSSSAPSQPTTKTVAAGPYEGLKLGSSGDKVKELQAALQGTGLVIAGGADGSFGNETRRALVIFQRVNKQPETGEVSARDAELLNLGQRSADDVNAAPNPYTGLTLGSTGAKVTELQQALIDAGITVIGGADGSFGPATVSALTKYQSSHGLSKSGAVDAATASHLGLGKTVRPTSPPADPDQPYVGLTVGSTGTKVAALQEALLDLGLVINGGADGNFGATTARALKAFQKVNGFDQTGVLTERGAVLLGLTTANKNRLVNDKGYPTKGESSERTRLLQEQLIAWGINVFGGADGSFGNATVAAVKSFQKSHGLKVTGAIDVATAKKMGLPARSLTPAITAADIKLDRFPVQGRCAFGNTWHAPRGGGRLHVGVDIIADEGKLLYAVVDGTITKLYWDTPGALAGNGLRVAQDDGTYFTYLHLLSFAPGIKVGTKVKAGDVIGFVGNTGSSATAHLHFEIHPGGGAAINPYPFVKAMDECEDAAPKYQSSFASG